MRVLVPSHRFSSRRPLLSSSCHRRQKQQQIQQQRIGTMMTKSNNSLPLLITTTILFVIFSSYEHQLTIVDAFTAIPLSKYKSNSYSNSYSPPRSQIRLYAEKQTRSSLLNPPSPKQESSSKSSSSSSKSSSSTATLEKPKEDEDEIYGAKFFGGSAIKEELFDAEAEEQADKLLKLYPPKQKQKIVVESEDEADADADADADVDSDVYRRFEDPDAFPDDTARALAQKLQAAINEALYEGEDGKGSINTMYSSTLKWDTPLSKNAKSPLEELTTALDFYKRIDVAIIAAKSFNNNSDNSSNANNMQKMEIRWEASVIWPNAFESRVLISGTSTVTVDTATNTILTQADSLDNGGEGGKDAIRAISSQLNPRFWDLYHVGMTPSAELMPRVEPTGSKKGLFSSYELFEIPPRLVLQPTIVDSGGRETREAQCLPNHAFSCVIKTTGPSSQRYITTSPIEVSIRRSSSSNNKSIISWNVPVPPEYISYFDEMTTAVSEDDVELGNDPTNSYVYQPRRLVATIKYGGNAQDVEVTDVRKKLYEQVVRDGHKPVLGEGGRPQFVFFQNDAKACFTADGGLGMAVYEWRPKAAKSNEVGIELEL